MAKIGTLTAELKYGPILQSVLEQQSALIVDRDKFKTLYESSQDALTLVLGELTAAKHELDSIKGIASV